MEEICENKKERLTFDELGMKRGVVLRVQRRARLVEMLNKFSDELHSYAESDRIRDFLMDEIKILEETKDISLPNFLPRTAFLNILQRKVKEYQLQLSTRRAANNLIAKMKEKSIKWMEEVVEMEMVTDYTCNPEYISEWNKLMAQQDSFISGAVDENRITSTIKLEGFGDIEVGHLKQYAHLFQQAFDLRMRMTAYWKIVLRRLVDSMALHLQLSVKNLVNKDLGFEIVNELFGSNVGGIERFMEESPSIASKRSKLNKSILKLKGCKDVVANIFDRIVAHAD
ncbi:hypothetical protein FEM48_Zijuj09G0153200 [Ziziphus jujuba var. spinosa]|uniref:GED domain-containing protein n=1 Tax=Ziziphus jujuba var. spinosa TaxID=714518 RepID=A0A978UTR5_ZIZJJ|nr:hypothetical protein FEM48_Zijuj09G0153200 [Ziziphus jujuba var. spinosa]